MAPFVEVLSERDIKAILETCKRMLLKIKLP